MSEIFQTRTEHSRSLEDAEKYQALEVLKEVGLLVPVSELETYHGRVGSKDSTAEWIVDPAFANGSNDSGNNNVNSRPTLYTGEREVAKDFAMERARQKIRPKYRKVFEDRVANYTSEERQEWLDRENERYKDWYENIEPDRKKGYEHLLDDNGDLKPKNFDDLSEWSESSRLEKDAPEDEKRSLWKAAAEGITVEVHDIVTADTDATVIDFNFDDSTLSDEALAKYQKALNILALHVTEGSPVGFDERGDTLSFATAFKEVKKTGFLLGSDITEIAATAQVEESVALQLSSAYNARKIAQVKPAFLVSEFLKRSTDIITPSLKIGDEKQEVPINLEYVQRYLREAHIVGVKQDIDSATLGRDIVAVSFFDLEKTTTGNALELERKGTWQRLGGMATGLNRFNRSNVQSELPLMHLLSDVHVKPETLVAAAKRVDGYNDIYEADAGNWEGYTLAEHTETVLRNFDENFAENIPLELLAPMRLAILSHDLGKPAAAANGEKHKQIEYNAVQANDFLDKLGVGNKEKELLLAMITDGEELAFQIEVRGAGEPAKAAMQELATKTLQRFYDTEQVTDEQITGFTEMCKMLQICDGGAYTSMAITRSAIKGAGRYRNAPSFNASFAQPTGFGKRTLRLRKDGDKAAESDLTP